MSLGERICYYRTKRNMSQGDLAEALDVSRQSVSKWETNASIPDLDKLVKLSALFSITLDELVKGTSPDPVAPVQTSQPATPQSMPGRKIAGIVLLSMAFLICLLITLVFGDLIEGLVLALPFTLCGVICLIFRKHTGLCCAWALTFLVDLFLSFAVGGGTWRSLLVYVQGYVPFAWSASTVIPMLHLLLMGTMVVVTVLRLGKALPPLPREKAPMQLGCGAGALLLLTIAERVLLRYCFALAETAVHFSAAMSFISLLALLFDWLQLGLIVFLLISALRLLRQKTK